jgi:hypothetical protein
MKSSMNQVVQLATVNIQNDLTYLSPLLGNRFTYNQFAQATMVDRFSQFWRDFSTNLTAFLAQDPYIIQFAITYPEILDGAIDPLASATNKAAYASLLVDVATRNRGWIPGTPLLTIPIQPIVAPFNNSSPDVNTNGWVNNAELDPAAFLARPDIQALPIPVQIAMLRTNLSYAGINTWSNNMQSEIAAQLAAANELLNSVQSVSFITATAFAAGVLTVTALNNLTAGLTVQISGTAEPFLNNLIYTVLTAGLSPTQFQVAATSPTNTITATSMTSNVLTVTCGVPNFSVGQIVSLNGTAESFLNGQNVTILSITGVDPNFTGFTANFTNPDYSNGSDTGTVEFAANPADFGTALVQ